VLATLQERFADRTTIVLGHDTVAQASPT